MCMAAITAGATAAAALIRASRSKRREEEILRHWQRVAEMKRRRVQETRVNREAPREETQRKQYLTVWLNDRRRDAGRTAV